MNLKVLLPTEIFLDEEVTKVTAEAQNGSFSLLPRHIDFVSVLVPGLLSFESEKEWETFIAVDEGILVKTGRRVMVSTRNAMRGPDLGDLKKAVEERFLVLEDKEKQARSAMAKIEANFVRRFLEIGRNA